MDKEELQGLLASIKEMTEQNKKILSENAELKAMMGDGAGTSRILKRVTQRVVEVRMIDGKVVMGYINHGTDKSPQFWYQKPDPKNQNQMIDWVDLVLEGAKEAMPVQVSSFRKESQRVKCRIVKVDEKEVIENQGVVKKREIEEYSSIELDFDVPLDVIHKVFFYDVEVPREFGGPREIKVHERMVNIA